METHSLGLYDNKMARPLKLCQPAIFSPIVKKRKQAAAAKVDDELHLQGCADNNQGGKQMSNVFSFWRQFAPKKWNTQFSHKDEMKLGFLIVLFGCFCYTLYSQGLDFSPLNNNYGYAVHTLV